MSGSIRRGRIKCWRIALLGSLLIGTIGAAETIEIGFGGATYPPGTGGASRPTAEKPQSKLWWNDNSWWGILWSTAGNGYDIHQLDPASQEWIDTGTGVDDRPGSLTDVLWDGQRLYVVSNVFSEIGAPAPPGERGELYRFTYDTVTRTYFLDVGFPVEVTGGTSEALVLEKDSTSQLWVTYVESGRVMVNHSVNGDDLTWAEPFVLPLPGADQVSEDDQSSIIAFNGFVGVMWSEQAFDTSGEDPDLLSHQMRFAVHTDGEHPLAWGGGDILLDHGDDHINLKGLQGDRDGSIFGVIKTERSSRQIVLLVCESSIGGCRTRDDWRRFEVFESFEFEPTRPVLLIDEENRELYVFATVEDANGQRAIYYKKTPIDSISFDTGIGMPFIRNATDLQINDPTSTKQKLNSTTDLIVLASDRDTNRYFHNYLDLQPPPVLSPF